MEIPSGAVADVMGRRRSMIASFLAYIGSFLMFGLCEALWTLFVAMFLFSIGEAFRTGTHKAMIFGWLERHNRLSEKTTVYGRTRSWSKLGSATSVVIATIVVFSTERLSSVFLFCVIPYLLNIVNFLGYPSYLDGPRAKDRGPSGVVRMLFTALSQSFRRRPLRRLLVESMAYDGLFQASKDYVQPIIKTACLSLPLILMIGDQLSLGQSQRVALAVGVVYFVQHLLGSFASRGAGRFAKRFGGESRAARLLWLMNVVVFVALALGILGGLSLIAILAFVLLATFQNFWRPILVGRVASHADSAQTATVLSIESQAKSLFVAIVAPLLGWSVDLVAPYSQDLRFMPIALLGILISALVLLTGRRADASAVAASG
jgi:MFS family permease